MRFRIASRHLAATSVRLRLTLWYTCMLAVTVAALGTALYFLLNRALAAAADQDVATTTLTVAQAIGTASEPSTGELQLILPEVAVLGDADTVVQVVDARTGQILARSANLGQRQLPPPSEPLPTTVRQSGGAYETFVDDNGRTRMFSRPVIVDGQMLAVVQAGHSLNADDRLLDRLRLLLIVVGGLGWPTAALLGWVLAGRALAPVAKANAQLADANVRLERSLAVQRRFIADASHELRTPLTTIRANADVLRWTMHDSTSDQLHALADLTGEVERMSRLLEGMLSLARVDAGHTMVLERVPLLPLLQEALRHAQLLAGGHIVELDGVEPADVRGNPDALRQLLLILVDNALKYTPGDGRIQLSLRRDNGQVCLSVSDTGVGISATELEHIFDRFYRADAARETDGSGLGLAIARSIVQQHHGLIEVESHPGRGSTFRVLLNAVEPALAPPTAQSVAIANR